MEQLTVCKIRKFFKSELRPGNTEPRRMPTIPVIGRICLTKLGRIKNAEVYVLYQL